MTEPVGMSAIVTQLTTGITSSTIFSVVGDVMPFVITLIPIALRSLYFKTRYKTVPQKQKLSSSNLTSFAHIV